VKLTQSGIVRALTEEIALTTSVATFICVFNAVLVTGFDDFAGVHHDALVSIGFPALSLPAMFFTLSSPALSLLLGTYIMIDHREPFLAWLKHIECSVSSFFSTPHS